MEFSEPSSAEITDNGLIPKQMGARKHRQQERSSRATKRQLKDEMSQERGVGGRESVGAQTGPNHSKKSTTRKNGNVERSKRQQ